MFYLLIDDDAIFNFVHAKIINQVDEQAQLVDFTSSTAALAFMTEQANAGNSEPIIVFLDINMPEMNGFELLDALLKLPSDYVAKLSIYIITSSLNQLDVQKSKGYSILKGYIAKPLSFDRVKEVVNFEKKR